MQLVRSSDVRKAARRQRPRKLQGLEGGLSQHQLKTQLRLCHVDTCLTQVQGIKVVCTTVVLVLATLPGRVYQGRLTGQSLGRFIGAVFEIVLGRQQHVAATHKGVLLSVQVVKAVQVVHVYLQKNKFMPSHTAPVWLLLKQKRQRSGDQGRALIVKWLVDKVKPATNSSGILYKICIKKRSTLTALNLRMSNNKDSQIVDYTPSGTSSILNKINVAVAGKAKRSDHSLPKLSCSRTHKLTANKSLLQTSLVVPKSISLKGIWEIVTTQVYGLSTPGSSNTSCTTSSSISTISHSKVGAQTLEQSPPIVG